MPVGLVVTCVVLLLGKGRMLDMDVRLTGVGMLSPRSLRSTVELVFYSRLPMH